MSNTLSSMLFDSLRNLLSGMGTRGDKSSFTRFHTVEMTRQQLESAYRGDWIARKVVDIPAQDATREWREWQAERADITALEEAERGFNLQKKLRQALTRARLHGGSALIMGIGQGEAGDPLDVAAVKKGDLKFVHVVSRHGITVGEVEGDVTSPLYGEPRYYATADGQSRIHPSRVVRLIGAERPDDAGQAWGDPVLQVVADAIKAAGTVAGGVASMVQEAKVDVVRVPGLTEGLADPAYEQRLKQRFGLAAEAKSIYDILLLDKEEEWQRISTSFDGLPDVLQMYLMIASGAADIPATRMLSQSPKGLNATGDSDTRNYYDRIKTEQKTEIGPALARLDEVLIRSALGARPAELHSVWSPLWQMDEAQGAEVASKKAATFKVDVDSGLIPGDVLAEARLNQLIEDGTYPGLEATLEAFRDGTLESLQPEGGDDPEAEAMAARAREAGLDPADPRAKPKAGPDAEDPLA